MISRVDEESHMEFSYIWNSFGMFTSVEKIQLADCSWNFALAELSWVLSSEVGSHFVTKDSCIQYKWENSCKAT